MWINLDARAHSGLSRLPADIIFFMGSRRCFLDDLEAAPPSRTELHQSCTELNMPEIKLMIGCPPPPAGVQ